MSKELEAKIKGGRAILKVISKDINQVVSTGQAVVNQGRSELLGVFKSMYPSLTSYRDSYCSQYKECLSYAILSENEALFPTDEDQALRREINSLYYKGVEYFQALEKSSSKSGGQGDTNRDTSYLDQSLARSRVPKINLPSFSGSLGDWPIFKQLFSSIINSNNEIPTIEKFHYLFSSLSGEPKTLISAFTLSEENYPKAWDALLQRYDNKRLLATSYFDKIQEFPPCKGPPSVASLDLFVQNVVENVSSFKSLSIKDPADFLWLTIASRKLDLKTRRQFETSTVGNEWPSFQNLVDFIQEKRQVLQLTQPVATSSSSSSSHSKSNKPHVLSTTQGSGSPTSRKGSICNCKQYHPLFQCPFFKNKSPQARKEFLKGKSICFNCLRQGHFVSACESPNRCHTCSSKHHTLLHEAGFQRAPPAPRPVQVISTSAEDSSAGPQPPVIASVTGPAEVLLGTAEAYISDSNGTLLPVRILIDCASQFSLITASCAKRLGLPWKATKHSPVGACQAPLPSVKGRLHCTIHSRVFPEFKLSVSPIVVGVISGNLPTTHLSLNLKLDIRRLADPYFEQPRAIDFLLGNDQFMRIITGMPKILAHGYGIFPTIFGDIIMGDTGPSCDDNFLPSPQCLCLTENPVSDDLLTRFWNIEELSGEAVESLPDPCEDHFVSTHYRTPTGQYVLALPFKESPDGLEESRTSSLSRFHSLERKLSRNPIMKEKYVDFLTEYESLGHMSLATQPSSFVIPHHGVLRSHHPDAKLRVVFDGSLSTSKGSLNDKLHIGRKLQKDIVDIVLNFRRHAIAVTADMVKMYRQILIRPEDRKYQHILWRPNPADDLTTYELNTVTYGLSSSPFQAIRTIKQLVRDEGHAFPHAAQVLEEDIYVDDIVSGAETIEEAVELRNQLSTLLEKGCFSIHKWASNSEGFLNSIKTQEEKVLSLSPKDSCVAKVLGMSWDAVEDAFFFQVEYSPKHLPTKRFILSTISRLFDPVGFLAPVIFQAKHILQQLWKSKAGWDDPPDPSLVQDWMEFSNSLSKLSCLRIPRFVLVLAVQELEIFGFSDASQKGFAAVVYLRSVSKNGEIKVSLLKAKTRLAPLKVVSIPRLELCAAHLLVKLMLSIKAFTQRLGITRIRYFSDSTVVLSWISISPHLLQTFVANRVSFIVSHTSADDWFHIRSHENPADVASRGMAPNLIQDCSLWWAGPSFLNELSSPHTSYSAADNVPVPELRSGVVLTVQPEQPYLISWISTQSRYLKMLRIMSYALRFIARMKGKQYSSTLITPSIEEVLQAELVCVRIVQRHTFENEFCWNSNRPTSKRLLSLSAFLDSDGTLRVGGRLQNADLPYNMQHPIIVPGSSHLCSLLIDHFHFTHFHLGHRALQALVRRKFWVFRLRQSVKSRINQCLTCFRMKARPTNPLMGNLPTTRVRPSRPFTNVGVDFAGPFITRYGVRRNSPQTKSYLCLFICLVTKAVHLEAVSSMSTDAFIASLERFIARRGLPNTIYSDCGSNFVGASRQLKELYQWWSNHTTHETLSQLSTVKGIHWSFIPPSSPHFGGIWESAIKSAKHHLLRVIGDKPLIFEELATLFARIEAILNSRPLCQTDDPHDGDFLTPGHFLVGAPLLSIPEKDLSHLPENRLSRWQLIQNSVQHFWKRWHSEYLHTLQSRSKWCQQKKPLQEGDLVLLSDPSSSPLNWRIARIVECHPGSDGVVRVVTIKDRNGRYKRPVHKLVSLAHLTQSSYST